MKLKLLPTIFLFVLLLCGSIAFADEQDALFANSWVLYSLNGTKIDLSLYQDRKPSLTFAAADRYAAYAGCNQISGPFILDGTSGLQFSPNSIMTKMFCSGPENIEDKFMAMLLKVRFWTIRENVLILQDQQLVELASFKPQLMS